MLLADHQIKSKSLIRNDRSENYAASSYYLTIGQIIPIEDEHLHPIDSDKVDRFELGPQKMAWIVSAEDFSLPDDVTGFATLVTRLTKDGILAFNVGVIDPNWHGPIGTVLVNFSKDKRVLEKGDQFFRVLFLAHQKPERAPHAENMRAEKTPEFYYAKRRSYVREAQRKALNEFPGSLLNIQNMTGAIWRDIFGRHSARIAVYAGALAFVVAAAQLVLGLAGVGVAEVIKGFGANRASSTQNEP